MVHDPHNIYDTPHGPEDNETEEVGLHAGINRKSVHRNWLLSGSLMVLAMIGLGVLVYIYQHRLEVAGPVTRIEPPPGDLEFLPGLNSNRVDVVRDRVMRKTILDQTPGSGEILSLRDVNLGEPEEFDALEGMTANVERVSKDDPGISPALREEGSIALMMTKLAQELYEKREFTEAIRTLELALEREPGFTEARELLAVVFLSSQDEAGAIEVYQELINRNPYRASYHNNIALARMKLGKEKAAEGSLLEALRLKSDYPDAKVNLGLLYFKKGSYHETVRYLTDSSVRRAHRDHPGVHYGIGVSLLELGRYHEARVELQEVIRLRKDRADVYFYIARSYAHEDIATKVYAWLDLGTEHSDPETFARHTAHPAFVSFKDSDRFRRIEEKLFQ